MSDDRIEIAKKLFAGWSSGNPDAPQELMTPDAVLHDVASGTFEGWPAIRAFFASGLARWDDLQLVPDEFWANDSGLALHYVMSATVKDASTYGPEHVGKKWSVEVMSYLRFDGEPGLLRGRLPRPGLARPVAGDHVTHQVRRCSGSSSCSPGVNCQRPVQTRRRNRHPAGVRTTTSS